MARPRTRHVNLVKQKLIARLGDGLHRPGDRFLSSRAIERQFQVSYQTADRLLRELQAEGRIQRRRASGSYVPGVSPRCIGVQLIFDRRARRAGSFGTRLLATLLHRLRRDKINLRQSWVESGQPTRVSADRYPILWESPATAILLASQRRRGLILHDRPPAGLGALLLDSISVDDFLGGACAAEIMAPRLPPKSRAAVFAGPREDYRSRQRVLGFQSIFPNSEVYNAKTWFLQDALPLAQTILRRKPAGIFGCNDRLAQAILHTQPQVDAPPPVLIGFDDAPIADALHLSTIAIPWEELAAAAVSIVARRLAGDSGSNSHLILLPKPIIRLT
jgi:hypothetical protein